jgi:hypothetical protein
VQEVDLGSRSRGEKDGLRASLSPTIKHVHMSMGRREERRAAGRQKGNYLMMVSKI